MTPESQLAKGRVWRPHRVKAGSAAQVKYSHQKRAGLGVWAVRRDAAARRRIVDWKLNGAASGKQVETIAGDLVKLIRSWSPVWPAGAVVTVPPQGASAPGAYAAGMIGRVVAGKLELPFIECLTRSDTKRHHGPWAALKQTAFSCCLQGKPPMILVIDDLITSGATMKLSIQALNKAGCTAFGFGWSGC